ncbi:PH domain-containing protein [Ferrimonas futtsuensis]|uniref:PH domain-containing protein n=1 Tax=Ferrimonas futtsuensis TaxID=364764 RepID=UPI0006870A24|nr:PH domain-containing protein [Ferrimonas futtsuensis]
MDMTFRSKIDTWLLVVLLLAIAGSLYGAVEAVRIDAGWVIACVLIITAGLLVWLLVSTKYVVNDKILRIKAGPFLWLVDIESIRSVRETRNPLSSPALSLDRLEISYGVGQTIMVSPKEKVRFLKALGQTAGTGPSS